MELGTPGCTGLKSTTVLVLLLTSTCSLPHLLLSTAMLPSLLLLLPGVAADPNSFTMSAGLVDFSNCTMEGDGKCCILSTETEPTAAPITPQVVECLHREEESCHYTFVTRFSPHQQEVCDDNYKKKCTIVFVTQSQTELVRKCYRPLEKRCTGEGLEECRDYPEVSCTTRYLTKENGKVVQDTSCQRIPRLLCGAGCSVTEGEEECHEKVVNSPVNLPEEHCDLSPQTVCHQVTRLVPRLEPQHECQRVPRQLCRPIQGPPAPSAPLMTKWCLQQEEGRGGKEVNLGDESQGGVEEEGKRAGQEGPTSRKGKKLSRQGNISDIGSSGKTIAIRGNVTKGRKVVESENDKNIETAHSEQGRRVSKKGGDSKRLNQKLGKDAEKNLRLMKQPRKGKAIGEISKPIGIQLPQDKSLPKAISKASQGSNVGEKGSKRKLRPSSLKSRTNSLPESRKNLGPLKKSKQSLVRPQPSPATLQARDFSSPSNSTREFSAPSKSTTPPSTLSLPSSRQKEGNIGHWIPAPSLAPFLPPSLSTVGPKSKNQQKSNRRGKGGRSELGQKSRKKESKKFGGSKNTLPQQQSGRSSDSFNTQKLGISPIKIARLSKPRKPEKERKASKLGKSNFDNGRKPGRHSYLPQPGDSLPSSANVPLLPPKKLSRLQLEEFSVIMPPEGGRGVATVMRPPSAISPAAKAPTKTAAPTTDISASAKAPAKATALVANLPLQASGKKAPTKELPASITVLSPPISVETNLPAHLPTINGTFTAEQPTVRIALPQSKKLESVSPLRKANTLDDKEEEGTPEPAPHQNGGENEEEAAPEPAPQRAREPKAVQAKEKHRGGYLPSPPTPVEKQRGGPASGARTGKTLVEKSETPAKKTENAKGGEKEGGRPGVGRRRKGGRKNQGGRKRKKQERKTLRGRKKAENVVKAGQRTVEREKSKKLKNGEEMLKKIKETKDPEVNLDKEEVRIHVAMKKMKNKVNLRSKQQNWSERGREPKVRGDDGSLDLPEIPLFSSGPGRKGRKYEVGLNGKELEEEEEEELPFYSLPRFSSLASLSRPPPQALLGLAGLAP